MKAHITNPNFYLMLAADALGTAGSLWLAYALRFDFFQSAEFTPAFRAQMLPSILSVVPLKLFLFYQMGLYRGMWRYTNLRDMRKIAVASATASLLIAAFIGYRWQFQGFSRGIYLLDALFTFAFASGLRISVREFFSLWEHRRMVNPLAWGSDGPHPRKIRAIAIGAGYCGDHLLRQLSVEKDALYELVCFLDDDPKKQGRSLHGVRIYGGIDRLLAAVERYDAQLILIAITDLSGERMRRIVEICEESGIPFKRVPSAGSIIDGRVSLKELRDVNYEDLLGRPPVDLDDPRIEDYLKGKTVLVTGAGGSIGSELVRQVVRFDPGQLVLVDCCEENLFNIQMELQNEVGFLRMIPAIARVQDREAMRRLFERYRPHTVFHAAAYKHVPLMEINPWEAVVNNVFGSRVVMQCARTCGVKRFVLVSTDKAVRPTNVMGATKRMTELIMHCMAKDSPTVFMAVRFGNVLGSSGSVVPLFRRQIERGGPVTVTHPDVTRYFMTIPEASRLILQAGALGEGGEIFILHMGTPVRIADMARDLIRLSGKEPDTEIRIECTGLRPGEKLYEELITEGEGIVKTRHEKIMVLRADNEADCALLDRRLDEMEHLASAHDAAALKAALRAAIPEYSPQESSAIL